MSRNQNSHFARAPHANIPRSRFDISHSRKQTMNAGFLVPFECKEVLPGDTFEVSTSILARMQTLVVPLMDDMYLDTYYFFVPNRLLWKNWEHFCGENDEPWFDDNEYSVPQIEVDIAPGASAYDDGSKHCVLKGTVADYLGMPLTDPDIAYDSAKTRKFNHLPFRAYVKIWNDWFRNENTQALAAFNTEDNDVVMNPIGEAFYGGKLLPVNKYRDYFTSCLPQPQRGDPVTVNIVGGMAPINTSSNPAFIPSNPINFQTENRLDPLSTHLIGMEMTGNTAAHMVGSLDNTSFQSGSTNLRQQWYADLEQTTGISINEIRYAFATQKYLEALARSGSRYIEMLEGIFGVTAPDQRLQRSEYLGGNRISININQAIQQSETGTTPLGNIGAYSLTTDTQGSFIKSFVEHGWILGLCCIRYDHSYQNGFDKMWLRKDFEDFYNPYFANIGEQPVENIEIYADGSSADSEVFGYQEAWADYRYANNTVASEMRSNYYLSLDYWHLADDYTSRPYLDDDWSKENGKTIDRAIAVEVEEQDQFLVDMYINIWATRPMPLYSVPGLDIL